MADDHLGATAFEEAAAARVAEHGLDLLTFRAAFDLVRASTRIVQFLETTVHRPAGWSFAGFRVMFCVWVAGELEPREIARLSGLSRAAVSSVLNTLERDDLVERSRESGDRRLVTVRLTPEGERRLTKTYVQQNQHEGEVFAALDEEELTTFTTYMRRLLAAPMPAAGTG
jgi:DNA-binding MarR family transcriptional regulator